jgi:hypothetical protein
MSRANKVNKDNYVQRGRLTPDEIARERMNQSKVAGRAKQTATRGAGKGPARGGQRSNGPRTRSR